MSDKISLEREYDVVAATGLQEPMIGDLAYDAARDCLWTILQEYKNHRPRLLRLDLTSGDIQVIDLPTERFAGGLTVGKDGCLLVGAMDGKRQRLLALDASGNVVRSVSTGRGWPSHIWETESGDLVMAGGSRRGFRGFTATVGAGGSDGKWICRLASMASSPFIRAGAPSPWHSQAASRSWRSTAAARSSAAGTSAPHTSPVADSDNWGILQPPGLVQHASGRGGRS